jgi:hypothetical protein
MPEESFADRLVKYFNIDRTIEAVQEVDVYFRNTYGVSFWQYSDGSICINDKKFFVGENTWGEVEEYIKSLTPVEIEIKNLLLNFSDTLFKLQKISDSLMARQKWAHLDEPHEILKLSLNTIKNSIEAITAVNKLIDINKKPVINPLPHYSEHIKEPPHGT